MHISLPAYDTRRGSSRHKGVDGYEAADAIEDPHERGRALSAVRSAGNRGNRVLAGAPSANQVATILADAMGLLLDDPEVQAVVKRKARSALKRSIRYRRFDDRNAEVKRLVLTRLRPNPKLIEDEMNERIAAEVEAGMQRRRSVTLSETIALLDSLRDDEGH